MDRAKLLASLSTEQLERACSKAQGIEIKRYRREHTISAAEAVEEILRRVGPAGEQARADEERYFESWSRESESRSKRYIGPRTTDWREISLAAVASDGSAAILSYVEAGSFLRRHEAESGWGGLHHLRFAVYLVVRDATCGDRHVIRVPARFGMYKSETYRDATGNRLACAWCGQRRAHGTRRACKKCLPGGSDGLILAATAWTFDLPAHEYAPQIAA